MTSIGLIGQIIVLLLLHPITVTSTYTKISVVALVLLLWIIAGIYILNQSLEDTKQVTHQRKIENHSLLKEQSKSLLYHYNESRKNTLY